MPFYRPMKSSLLPLVVGALSPLRWSRMSPGARGPAPMRHPLWVLPILVSLSLALPLLAGCGGEGTDATPLPVNLAPQVVKVSAEPSLEALPGDHLSLEIEAVDPEGDAFTIQWSALEGSFEPATNARTLFTVPDHLGPLELKVTLTDDQGQQSTFSLIAVVGYQPIDDADQDGLTWEQGDCNDLDASIYPEAIELVDGKDNDCNGYVDEGSYVSDDDGDRWSELNGDCNDADPDIFPTNPEVIDDKDNDCDGYVDEDTERSDDDGDGINELSGDCNDGRIDVYPGAPELADHQDNNCDGVIDEGTVFADDDGDGLTEVGGDCDDDNDSIYLQAPELTDGLDNDCDGLIDEGSPGVDDDGDGLSEDQGDCNDADPSAFPGATEQPNGQDDDCDGTADNGTVRGDDDHDGVSEVEGDCHDDQPTVYPAAPELADGLDNDCDGIVDEGTPAYDSDGDGASPQEGDCDDHSTLVYPGATEYADGMDNDCDGLVDEGTLRYDDDQDGYSELDGDCDDARNDVYPGATEVLDGRDNNCDGIGDPNQPPVAVADAVNPATTCSEIPLEGSDSYDPDGDPLKYYYWFVDEVPSSSVVSDAWILNAEAAVASLVTDVAGSYSLGLIVSDGVRSSAVAPVTFSVTERGYNHDPVGEAGNDQSLYQTVKCSYNGKDYVCPACNPKTITLDGRKSTDPDGDRLFYQWAVSSSTTSQYTFSNPTSATPTLTLTAPPAEFGRSNTWSLFFKLEVKDCKGERDADTVLVSYTCTGG